jgi:hypothetical protein
MISSLLHPAWLRTVIICADNDGNGAGQRAANAAAQRLRREGREASVWMSPHVGTDANDLLLLQKETGTRYAA